MVAGGPAPCGRNSHVSNSTPLRVHLRGRSRLVRAAAAALARQRQRQCSERTRAAAGWHVLTARRGGCRLSCARLVCRGLSPDTWFLCLLRHLHRGGPGIRRPACGSPQSQIPHPFRPCRSRPCIYIQVPGIPLYLVGCEAVPAGMRVWRVVPWPACRRARRPRRHARV